MSAKPSASIVNMSSADAKPAKKAAAPKVAKAAVPAPAAAAAPATAPAAEPKAAKAPRKTAAKTEVVVPTVAAPAVPLPPSPATEAAAGAAAPASIAGVVDRIRELRSRLANDLKEIIADTLLAAKTAAREVKDAKRKRRVKKDVADMTPEEKTAWELRRSKNAFLKPRALSADLCSFMKLPAGSQRSQTEVTKFVSNYVKENSCFDPANKRHIIPDGVLSRLLKVKDTDTVTYLNLQSFLKIHFLKA
jgi:chromatin remodeling complex protein RSC6